MKSDKPLVSNQMILYFAFILFVLEFLLFKTSFAVNYQPYYPRAYDQTALLQSTYATYFSIHDYGVIHTARNISILQTQLFKGPIIPNTAVLLMFLFGPDRLSAISVNFLFFILGQIVLFYYFKEKISVYAGAVAVGLFFFSITHYFWAGGMTDFRFDYAGMVTFGIVFLTYINLIDKPTKAAFFLACIVTVLTLATRSITGVYALVLVTFLNVVFFLNLKFKFFRQINTTQLRYFAYLLIIFVAVSGIAFVIAGGGAVNYYSSLFHGSEREIRAAAAGATSVLKNLNYYPESATVHFKYYGYILIGLIFYQGIRQIFLWSRPDKKNVQGKFDLGEPLFLFFITVISIWMLLLVYAQSPLVIGVLTIPIVFILTLIISKQTEWMSEKTKIFISGAIIFVGFLFYANNMVSPSYLPPRSLIEARKINVLYQDIEDILINRNTSLKLSWMMNHEAFIPTSFNVYLYEQNKRIHDIPLPSSNNPGIFSATEDDIIKQIEGSDIVVAPVSFYPVIGFEYPFTQSLREYEVSWRKSLQTGFVLEKEYDFKPYWVVGLYVKSCVITHLDIPNSLEHNSLIPFFWLGNDRATIRIKNYSQNPINANFQAVGGAGPSSRNTKESILHYEINGNASDLLLTEANGWSLSIPMILQPGNNILFISDIDKAYPNKNGDRRQLLSRISNLNISCQLPQN